VLINVPTAGVCYLDSGKELVEFALRPVARSGAFRKRKARPFETPVGFAQQTADNAEQEPSDVVLITHERFNSSPISTAL
jgi:hypothetical protein